MFDLTEFLDRHAAWLPLLIFLCRVCDVSLGTVRTILVVRGNRVLAPLLGLAEVTIWVVALSSVVKHLNNASNIATYAAGFAAGNWVGMWLESKLALGEHMIQIISRDRGHSVAHALRMAGSTVTEVQGRGSNGPVVLCFAAATRKRTRQVLETVWQVDPDAFVTVEDTRDTPYSLYRAMGTPKTGWRAILKKK